MRHTHRKPKPLPPNRQPPNLPPRNLCRVPRAARAKPHRSRLRRNRWQLLERQPRLLRPVRQSPCARFPNHPPPARVPSPERLARVRPPPNRRARVPAEPRAPERPHAPEGTSPAPRPTAPPPVPAPARGPARVVPQPPRDQMCVVPALRVPATTHSRFPREWVSDVPGRNDVTREAGRAVNSGCRVPAAPGACPAPIPR